MKITLLGAKGQLGQDMMNKNPDPVRLSIRPHGHEADITNAKLMEKVIREDRPDWVINAAAFNNVDESETDPEAFRVNAEGPAHLARICEKLDIPLIHISTDYVFPHRQVGFYTEIDDPKPVNKYGQSKWEGEKGVEHWGKHFILRTSSLYGRARSNHASRVLEAFKTGQPVKIVNDLYCCPTYTGHLALWIFNLIKSPPPYGLYHLCHAGDCTRYEFALRLCELAAPDKKSLIHPISVADLHLKAPRPLRTSLSMDKWQKAMGPLPHWKEGLIAYLNTFSTV